MTRILFIAAILSTLTASAQREEYRIDKGRRRRRARGRGNVLVATFSLGCKKNPGSTPRLSVALKK